jgi:ribonuclease P protein component
MKHIAISENHLYSKAYAKGDKFVARHLIVYILKDFKATRLMRANPEKEYINRIGLTVSKKIGKAHIRNRIKRILREGLRQTEKENNLKKGYLIVLVARPSAQDAGSDDIRYDLTKAFKALKFISDEKNS